MTVPLCHGQNDTLLVKRHQASGSQLAATQAWKKCGNVSGESGKWMEFLNSKSYCVGTLLKAFEIK